MPWSLLLEPDNHNDCIAFGRQYNMEVQLDQWVPVYSTWDDVMTIMMGSEQALALHSANLVNCGDTLEWVKHLMSLLGLKKAGGEGE